MKLIDYKDDIFLYYGSISKQGYHLLSGALEARVNKHPKACLVLVTYGGDPDAGYRIARALNHHYEELDILIPDVCKSAGTLICIGAKRLIFGDRGELGPLDIQLSKPDEMFESMSGLDIIQALNALENQILNSFRNYLVDIRGGSGIRTKMAADIATKLAEGFVAPIAEKIDPVTLGEHQRAMNIGYDYGQRLENMSGSLKGDTLVKLVSSYPSHGFVIDRKEASELFKNVSEPIGEENDLYFWAREIVENIPYPHDHPFVVDIKNEIDKKEEINEQADVNEPAGDSTSVESGAVESVDQGTKQESEGDESINSKPNKKPANQKATG